MSSPLVAALAYKQAHRRLVALGAKPPRGQGHYVDGPRRSFSGGAGMVSTARDYGRLLQMLLNGRELNGARVLSPKSVALMTTNQTDTLYPQKGVGFGFGFSIVQRLGADNTLSSEGTYGWGGAYGSNYRVDQKSGSFSSSCSTSCRIGRTSARCSRTSCIRRWSSNAKLQSEAGATPRCRSLSVSACTLDLRVVQERAPRAHVDLLPRSAFR